MKQNWSKKALGMILSLAMVLTSAVPVTAQNLLASSVPYEDIKSTNGGRSTRQTMENNSAIITVEALTEGSFRTSVVEGDKYITTTSAGESWYTGATGDAIIMENGTAGTGVIQGHIYEVRYTRADVGYTIEYYDYSVGASLYTYRAENTNLTGSTIEVYAKAVDGTYRVYNCSAGDAGFQPGDVSESIVEYSHGVNRHRYVSAPDNTVPEGYDVNPATQGSAKNGDYNKYFLKDSLQTVRITMDEDNLDYVLQHSAGKESALAKSATIGDTTVENVGFKTKGNFTRDRVTESDNDRFSFTINFGKYVKKKNGYSETQNFYGCRKISFNNFYFDATMMKEYNAFRMMAEMGVPTSQFGLAKLYINDQFYGVYFMVEAMDSSILEQYYDSSSKDLSSFLVKPFYYSPRYYSPDLDNSINENGEITWDAMIRNGQIIDHGDGTYGWGNGLNFYSALWENDSETFQDIVKDLPAAMTWMYRLTRLSTGKDFSGNDIDVNSDKYLELLGQVIDIDESLRYFAAHSFVIQMDNMFTCRQNYALYVNSAGKSLIVPWDYDLAWGCFGNPGDPESVANWDIDKLYNESAHYYVEDMARFYEGDAWNHYYDDGAKGSGSGYPLFNVIYKNKTLMEKFHTYVEDCSKIAALGGTTSFGTYYESGRFAATIDSLYDEVVAAASEPLASNAEYFQYSQPDAAKKGLSTLKKIITRRSVGAWLQVNGIQAKVTGYGCDAAALGNDIWVDSFTTDGNNIAVVDDETGIFTIGDYSATAGGPTLNAKVRDSASEQYKTAETLIKEQLGDQVYGGKKLTVYTMVSLKKPTQGYRLFLPAESENVSVYLVKDGKLTLLDTKMYGGNTVQVSTDDISTIAILEDKYTAEFVKDEGVDSIDVYYTQNYDQADEQNVTSTYVRNGDAGNIDVTGDGQVNFKVNLKEGYKIDSISVSGGGYKNIKTPAETEASGVYRITKISGDVTITVKTVPAQQYTADFICDEGIESVDIYHTSTYGSQPDESGVESAIVRNSKTGESDVSGEGQINFRITIKPDVMLKSITVTGGYYSNLKLPEDTGAENVYRLTKVEGDVTITIETQPKVDAYEGVFEKDEGVASIDVYYTQDYSIADEKNVQKAYARSKTGGIDVSGEGQINFKVNLKDGYVVKSVSADQNYKNIKTPDGADGTGAPNVYRITKLTGPLTITVVTEKSKSDSGNIDNGENTNNGGDTGNSDSGSSSDNGNTNNGSGNNGVVGTSPNGNNLIESQTSSNTQNSIPKVSKPSKVSIKSAKNSGKKKITVTWKKQSKVMGYQIQYATKSSFKSAKKVTIKGASKTKTTISKLKKGKTYYVKVRAYVKSGGKTVYGKWSAVKKVKIRK